MKKPNGIARRAAGLLSGAALTATALIGTSGPAQAYGTNPVPDHFTYDTDTCPCSGGNLTDPFDGTYFEYDAGGRAQKVELYSGDWFIGKVEFHPSSEKLWIYDTRNDGDTFYVKATYRHNGTTHDLGTFSAPGTSAVMDYTVKDFDLPEGSGVIFWLYDESGERDYFGSGSGIA
ncbi:hypothetical protein H9Y04_09390 [Streptomyces sp. TRM66268-LWL]|uniref:Secreted protein n=1 Tax=Streptomyces polyasparticus TaxID=2767826 RepID=A0ABR7SBD0_9ACTN|nr:hypothetical protein [Streptomyces polyasparticus]MBC9712785.1 hypothetical protein [Streptomyces polyasparticus]